MARYEGRHRTLALEPTPETSSETIPGPTPQPTPQPTQDVTPLRASSSRLRRVGRPLLVGTLAVGLGASALAYAGAHDLDGESASYVVGAGVVAQTDELARSASVDTSYREQASVSRNERRTALSATGVDTATELEAAAKAAADKRAKAAKAAADAKAKAVAAAKAKADREAAAAAAVANAKKDPKAAARVLMADQGWTSTAQYTCLDNLWVGESDWRWSAENASSGAYGIPQSLPARKMAQFGADYRTNPLTQIKWGLWYIKMSYGSPCNAWSTWQSRSPHWY
ncbi:MAG: lytic transglycosylase domain-containing protein [Terracoccus sp.]